MNQAHASNSSKTRSKLALRGCTTDPHYHLLCAATGGRFDKGSYDKENEIFVWDSNSMNEGLFSPFYLSNDGRWRSRFNPNIQLVESVETCRTYTVCIGGMYLERTVRAPIDFTVIAHGAPEYIPGPHMHDPRMLLELMGAPTGGAP
ncbi:MAG: hypothetical protein JRN62_02920 [Nitrososphaerota archaeon]|jgi:hypothetical protein|nr:hypothetical protein [Nitrososphaerota archaeon]MDG6948946.1 hypothetical protein [Nitrososphaerota archaeon]